MAAPLSQAEPPARNFRLPSLYHVGFWVRDLTKSRAFYQGYLGYAEPYGLNFPNGTLQLAVQKINERQVIYLFPNAAKILPSGDNLDHLGLETDNANAMYDYLLARGLKVSPPKRGRIGDLLLGIRDPDGHPFEVTQFEPEGQLRRHAGQSLAPGRISLHLRSIGITVADVAASRQFYEGILGFRPLQNRPGPLCLQVPDGTDYLVLLPTSTSPRAVPEFSLEVPDAAAAAATLTSRATAAGIAPPGPPELGADGRRQIVTTDPDGTRVILTE